MRSLVIYFLAVFFSWPTPQQPTKSSAINCQEFGFDGQVNGGEEYSHRLGSGLWLRLAPLKDNWGWIIQVQPEGAKDDYAFPVNPPFHSDNSQWLGTGYGETAVQQLRGAHKVFFAPSQREYQRNVDFYESTLDSKDPGGAAKFLSSLPSMRSAVLLLKPGKFETSDDGESVAWMQFSITVTVPKTFEPAANLKARNAACVSGGL